MLDTLDDILRVVTFIAAGGLVAIIFFFIFAQTITGSRTVHKQLEKLIRQNDEIARLLKQLKTDAGTKKSEKDES